MPSGFIRKSPTVVCVLCATWSFSPGTGHSHIHNNSVSVKPWSVWRNCGGVGEQYCIIIYRRNHSSSELILLFIIIVVFVVISISILYAYCTFYKTIGRFTCEKTSSSCLLYRYIFLKILTIRLYFLIFESLQYVSRFIFVYFLFELHRYII